MQDAMRAVLGVTDEAKRQHMQQQKFMKLETIV